MTVKLRTHPEYRDAGLQWLGGIPSHWEVRRNGRLFAERNETGFAELPILEVSLKTGVRVRDMENLKRKQVLSDREKYKRAVKNDIAYNMMRMWQGAVGVAPEDGLVSPAYVVARPYPEVEPRYFSYLFRTDAYKNEVDGYSRGIVKDRNRLYWEDFKRMPSCAPPREEQKAIADYLDGNAVEVRRFIRNRRRLIEVLNEQKQAIINRAVTRGLDPSVPLNPSGIDWLGDVPRHWRLFKIKRIARLNPSRAESSHLRESDKPVVFLPMERVSTAGEVDAAERRPIHEVWQGFTYFRRGDVVVAKITPCFENGKGACLSELDTEIGFGTTEFIVLRPSPRASAEFLYQLTQLAQFRLLGVESMTGAAGQQRVSPDFVADFVVPVPPADEQEEIVAFIRSETVKFCAVIDRAQREIDLIREYRTRLITDVVTGKLDVCQRAVAVAATKPAPPKRTANIHFRRSVFAAEIVQRLHQEPTFGHVKCQKLIFLCEKRCSVDTGSTYRRQAAGPYDNRALRSIDSQLKKQQWYEARKGDKGYRYVPLAKAGGHSGYFNRYFGNVASRFDEIIDIFRTAKTDQCEIVATLYAAWEDLLTTGNQVTDNQIVEQVLHHWHPSKQKITEERWRRALGWIKAKGLTPVTRGDDHELAEEAER